MCGILGTVGLPFDESILNLMSHRGPDGSGMICLTVGEHHLTLGHRRLAIVDLTAAGHQPMQTPCGMYSVVYNGEIYNHMALRPDINNVIFRGHSDTETILHYIAQRGIDAARDFNGIFALGLVDTRARKLFLVRDPFGVKPLYYFHQGHTFAFSSEIRPLRRLVDDQVDRANLATLLRLRYSPSPDTLFRHIHKVRPGHVLEVDLSRPELRIRTYAFASWGGGNIHIPYGEAVKNYGTLVEEAVKRQLMSDVEVGVLLSGGIDSAVIAALMQRHVPYRAKAFTVGFTDYDMADEVACARETAALIGMEHHVTRMGFHEFLSTLRQCTLIVEEPLATTSVIPMFHLLQLVSGTLKVVLCGQGADELLGGYTRYQGEICAGLVPRALARPLRLLARIIGLRDDRLLRGLRCVGERDDLDRFLVAYSVFEEKQIPALIGQRDTKSAEYLRYFFDLLQCQTCTKSVERMMSLDLRMNLADDLLLYTDKIAMHHSVECRVPMLDFEVVRFVESLPCHYKIALGRSKIVHKHLARQLLPSSVVKRPKKGFLSPTRTWFMKRDVLRDVLLDRASRFASFFDLRAVDQVLAEHERGFDRQRQIFLLLSLYYWMSEYA